jgi:hypothetical protein
VRRVGGVKHAAPCARRSGSHSGIIEHHHPSHSTRPSCIPTSRSQSACAMLPSPPIDSPRIVGTPETDRQISLIIMSQIWERHHERSCNLNQCGEYNLIHNRNFTCAGRVERLCSIVRTNSCIVQFTSEPLARTECMTISHIAFSSNSKNRFIQDGVVTY